MTSLSFRIYQFEAKKNKEMSSHFWLGESENSELIIDRIGEGWGWRFKWYQLFLVRKCPFHLALMFFFFKKKKGG